VPVFSRISTLVIPLFFPRVFLPRIAVHLTFQSLARSGCPKATTSVRPTLHAAFFSSGWTVLGRTAPSVLRDRFVGILDVDAQVAYEPALCSVCGEAHFTLQCSPPQSIVWVMYHQAYAGLIRPVAPLFSRRATSQTMSLTVIVPPAHDEPVRPSVYCHPTFGTPTFLASFVSLLTITSHDILMLLSFRRDKQSRIRARFYAHHLSLRSITWRYPVSSYFGTAPLRLEVKGPSEAEYW